MATLDDVFAKLRQFNEMLYKNRSFGTMDLEFRFVRANIMEQVYAVSNYVAVPNTAQGWKLHQGDGAEQLAKDLHKSMVDIVDTIDQISFSDFKVLLGKDPVVNGIKSV
jgi:hypothetical protein